MYLSICLKVDKVRLSNKEQGQIIPFLYQKDKLNSRDKLFKEKYKKEKK